MLKPVVGGLFCAIAGAAMPTAGASADAKVQALDARLVFSQQQLRDRPSSPCERSESDVVRPGPILVAARRAVHELDRTEGRPNTLGVLMSRQPVGRPSRSRLSSVRGTREDLRLRLADIGGMSFLHGERHRADHTVGRVVATRRGRDRRSRRCRSTCLGGSEDVRALGVQARPGQPIGLWQDEVPMYLRRSRSRAKSSSL